MESVRNDAHNLDAKNIVVNGHYNIRLMTKKFSNSPNKIYIDSA